MDALEALVEGPRARGAIVLRLELDSDWSIRVADESLLTVMPVQAGSCTVTTESAAAHASAGDVVVVRGPGAYSVASDPDRPPDFIIEPNQVCIDVDGNRLVESMRRGIRTWGTTAEGVDRILVGTYAPPLEVGRLLVELLPRNAEVTQARDRIQSVESGAAREEPCEQHHPRECRKPCGRNRRARH